MLSSAPAARSATALPSSSTRDALLLPSPRLAIPNPILPKTDSGRSPSRSGSASSSASTTTLVTCHVCGDQTRKSSLAFHQRKCIRDHIGRLSLDRTAHSLQHSSSPTHQCTSCAQFVAAHLFPYHLRTCRGNAPLRPYTTPAAPGPNAKPIPQFTNGVRSPLPPIDLSASATTPLRGMPGRTVSDSVVDYAPTTAAAAAAPTLRPASRLGAIPPLSLPSFASDPALAVDTTTPPPPPPPPLSAAHAHARLPVPDSAEAQDNDAGEQVPPESLDVLNRVPCPLCARKFVPESLPRHELACAKIHAKRRPVFNAQAKRVQGTELEKFVQVGGTGGAAGVRGGGEDGAAVGGIRKVAKKQQNHAPPDHATSLDDPTGAAPTPAWKSKSDAMRTVMKAARQGLTAPPQANPDYIPCPTCGRKFNEEAAKRHLQPCAERKQREAFASPGGGGGGQGKRSSQGAAAGAASASTEEMLLRRTKYQPPLPGSKKKKAAAEAAGAGAGAAGTTGHQAAAPVVTTTRGRPCCPGCGAGYLTQEAKFCFECGTRRAR